MDWRTYRNSVETRISEINQQLQWMHDYNVATRQKRAADSDWTDTTASTKAGLKQNLADLEQILSMINEKHPS